MASEGELAERLTSILDCEAADAARLAPAFRERRLPHAAVLAGPAQPMALCWFVVDGSLSLSMFGEDGQMAQVATFGPGELAGAFPEPREQVGELRAHGSTELIEVETARLLDLVASERAVGRGMALLLARQQALLVDRLAGRMMLSAAGRVYAELLRFADDRATIAPPPVVTALALRAHTARETASRALAVAERRGLIERDHEALRIVSADRLRALVV